MEVKGDVVNIDGHRAWIEEPYALVSHIEGELTDDHMGRMRDMMDFIGGGQGPVVIVQDLSKAGEFTSAARKGVLKDERSKRITTVICIGASFQTRVFVTMIGKAMKLVNPKITTTLFAKNDAEAREMLAAERERLKENN